MLVVVFVSIHERETDCMNTLRVTNSTWFRREFFVVLLCSIILTLPWIDRPFHTRGEPREALVAQAMLDTGDWTSPQAYDGAVPSKPPFLHWLITICSIPGGEVTEATCRLPSAISFILFSALFFQFLVKRTSSFEACATSLILLSCFEWFRGAVTCRVDTLLAVSMSGCLLALYAWWEKGYRGVPWVAIGLASCATLTKGPVGFVLPLGILALFSLLQDGCSRENLRRLFFRCILIGLPTMVVSSVWYLLGYQQRGDVFVAKVLYENFARFTSTMADKPHQHSMWYLFGMLLLGILPWTVPLLSQCVRLKKPYLSSVRDLRKRLNRQDSFFQFSLISALCIVLFFCIPSSKRSVYLLPAYPFIAFLVCKVLLEADARVTSVMHWTRIVIAIVVTCASAIALGSEWYTISGFSVKLRDLYETLSLLKVSVCVGAGLLLIRMFRSEAVFQTASIRLALSMIGAVVLASFFVYDTAARVMSPKSWYRDRAITALEEVNPSRSWFSYGIEMYGASFYLHRPFQRLEGKSAIVGDVVVTQRRHIENLQKEHTYVFREVLSYRSGVEKPKKERVVLEITALR
jgi:4-amino-4-deoxy-L-arabinose transferase-like glycosyltransferase